MSSSAVITVGLSSHRLEVLPLARPLMAAAQAIVLEEAPETDFGELLTGRRSAAEYLEDKEVEFPEFSRGQLEMLVELYRAGKEIVQVEPYLERLIRIHESLAAGVSREEVEHHPELKDIYAMERLTSRALLTFYAAAHTAPFPRVVAAVQDFARADAQRFRLRDELRAAALVPLASRYHSLYVEAGHIHLYLLRALRRHLNGRPRLRPVFLLAHRALPALGRPRSLGPGDLLTLHHIFGSPLAPAREELLAARSLIYIQLLEKKEMAPGADPTPHLTDEIQAARLTDRLTLTDCAALYPRLRALPPPAAVAAVQHYVGQRQEEEGEECPKKPAISQKIDKLQGPDLS